MLDLIKELWFLKRDIISDDYDKALNRLAQDVPMNIHEYPTGEPCWTWRVPEKWTCQEAYLETLDGRRLIDYAEHPLHVVSYSLPFEGVVSRQELFNHLHVHPRLPDVKTASCSWRTCATLPRRTMT
jgi:aminopeptidase-like protein